MIDLDTGEDLLQVAAVRLRLEGTPFAVLQRSDLPGPEPDAGWPFADADSCVVFCRTDVQPGERLPTVVLVGTLTLGYVLRDGVERVIPPHDSAFDGLRAAAVRTRGLTWMASGGPGMW